MKRLMLGVAVAVAILLNSGISTAGLLGSGGFRGVGTSACSPCGDFVAARCGCGPQCQTVQEVVWETQQYTCMKTVYDQCTESVPVSCTRNVY